MKLRISFFDSTVLRKDITRFSPIWAVYTIFGLLFQSLMIGNSYYQISGELATIIGPAMGLINAGYGIVVALFLFGDLSNNRLCNALHAMPLRRETWFCTHFAAGLLFSLVPNTLMMLIFMPVMGSLWFTSLIWLGGATLSYLFFFGAAVLSIMSTGTRFGAMTVYGLINFVAIEIYWMVLDLIIPMYRGVRLKLSTFAQFSPVVGLCSDIKPYFTLKHMCPADAHFGWMSEDCIYKFDGFGPGWGYLFAIAAVGIAFSVLALVLYRHRHLESAGDFAAVKPVKWAVSIFGSLGFGMVFRVFGYGSDGAQMLLLFIGIAVGFILLQMLLQRRVKVFNRRTFIKLTVLCLAVILFLALGYVDILNVEGRVPKAENVKKVQLSNTSLSPEEFEQDLFSYYRIALTDLEDIERVCSFHQEVLGGRYDATDRFSWITIYYELKDGSTLCRTYSVDATKNIFDKLSQGFQPELVFGVSSVDEILKQVFQVTWDSQELTPEEGRTLLLKLWKDAKKGNLSQDWYAHDENLPYIDLYIVWGDDLYSATSQRWITVRPDATESWEYLELLQKFYDLPIYAEDMEKY